MSFRRLLAITWKESLHIFRDARSLMAAIGIPVVMMLLYCYSLSLDVDHIPTAVLNLDRSRVSADFLDGLQSSGYFDLKQEVKNNREMNEAMDSGRCVLGLVLPRSFGADVTAGKETPVQVLLDGTDPNRASISLGYISAVAQTWSLNLISERMRSVGRTDLQIPVDPRIRVWFNPELKSRNFIIPGLIAMIMAILASLLTSITLAREWENGTMELLISTPAKAVEIILGKLIPYFVLGFFDTTLIALLGWTLFGVAVKGSLLLLGLFIGVFLVGVLTLGMMISALLRSQLLANQIAFLATFLPTLLLSGFVFYIPSMPKVIQFISYIIPARYFISALRGIYLKAVGIGVLWEQLLFLLIFDLVVISLTIRKFIKKME